MDATNEFEPGPLPRFPIPQEFAHLCDQADVRGCKIGLSAGASVRRHPERDNEVWRDLTSIRVTTAAGGIYNEVVRGGDLDGAAERLTARLPTR